MTAIKPITMFYEEPEEDSNRWLRPALMTSESVEWYTPVHVRNAVVAALGGRVDLDPCADPGKTFPAAEHFTPLENGLAQRWTGRVYMNPPYGRKVKAWTTKLRDELNAGWVTEAVALLPVRTETDWWQNLRPETVFFFDGRLKFSGYDNSAPFPSAAIYFGDSAARFVDAFAPLGGLFYATLRVR